MAVAVPMPLPRVKVQCALAQSGEAQRIDLFFTFEFFIIHFNNETESFDDLFRSFLKVFTFVDVLMLKSIELNEIRCL